MHDTLHRIFHLPYRLHVAAWRRARPKEATYVFVHGIGATGQMWGPVISQLPESANYIVIDLLGFGDSPKPRWQTYDAVSQAKCVERTLRKHRVRGDVILIGHSMGSLIAVELAQLMRSQVKRLLLCSPPIYEPEAAEHVGRTRDQRLRRFYRYVETRPRLIVGAYGLMEQLKIAGPGLRVDQDNVLAFTTALRASIINQSTIEHLALLRQPVQIINGSFDPLTVKANLRRLDTTYHHISYREVRASHSINRAYAAVIVETLGYAAPAKRRRSKRAPQKATKSAA